MTKFVLLMALGCLPVAGQIASSTLSGDDPNWGIPGPNPDFGPFFGKIFSSDDPRRMQFALRYDF